MQITKAITPNRGHIKPEDIEIWIKRWNVPREALQKSIEKAGDSVAAVRKELVLQGLIEPGTDTPNEKQI